MMFLISSIFLGRYFAIENPEDFVNLLAGTFTDGGKFSTGNTLPLIGMPFGFNHWAPQTIDENPYSGSWWFHGSDHILTWLRCTHQPSPWIGDWGYFAFTAMVGGPNRNPQHFWEPRGATIRPYLFDATVAPHGIRMELTPTMHGAILKVTFPSTPMEKRICFTSTHVEAHGTDGVPWLRASSRQVHQDRMPITNFGLYIRAESAGASSVDNDSDMTCFQYRSDSAVVFVRIATSLISHEQAQLNLNQELPVSKDFDAILADARNTWNGLLKRVDVVDPSELSGYSTKHLTVFYTGLVRALSFPRRIDEINAAGQMVHYSPYDPRGQVHPGPLVTDNGFWDTFRTVYPMLSLLYPDLLGPIIQGWLNAYKEGGWLPSWASPGYRNCMVGTFADVVIADAIVKEIPNFDLELAIEALMKDSFEEPPPLAGNAVGKEGLNDYQNFGYIPIDSPQQGGDRISRTLDFGFADLAVSNAFEKLAEMPVFAERKDGLLKKVEILRRRSNKAMVSLFDSSTGFMVAKSRNNQKLPGFNSIEWGNGYTEGNAWHHSFPPYSLDTLISLHGSQAKLLGRLKSLLTATGNFEWGSYNQEIHEMVEARALAMGQYSHNNQPCHHILYLFALLGDRATTETTVRHVMQKGYGVDFYAGDEDNGEMGAWFVLSALGVFVTTPSTEDYVLGSPVFRHVRITRVDGAVLDVIAPGTREGVARVRKVLLNGVEVKGPTVKDRELQGGSHSELRFIMEGEDENTNQEYPDSNTAVVATDKILSAPVTLINSNGAISNDTLLALQSEIIHGQGIYLVAYLLYSY